MVEVSEQERLISDILSAHYTLGEVNVVKHNPREFRSLQGRVEQNLDSIFGMIQVCLPEEMRKATGGHESNTKLHGHLR